MKSSLNFYITLLLFLFSITLSSGAVAPISTELTTPFIVIPTPFEVGFKVGLNGTGIESLKIVFYYDDILQTIFNLEATCSGTITCTGNNSMSLDNFHFPQVASWTPKIKYIEMRDLTIGQYMIYQSQTTLPDPTWTVDMIDNEAPEVQELQLFDYLALTPGGYQYYTQNQNCKVSMFMKATDNLFGTKSIYFYLNYNPPLMALRSGSLVDGLFSPDSDDNSIYLELGTYSNFVIYDQVNNNRTIDLINDLGMAPIVCSKFADPNPYLSNFTLIPGVASYSYSDLIDQGVILGIINEVTATDGIIQNYWSSEPTVNYYPPTPFLYSPSGNYTSFKLSIPWDYGRAEISTAGVLPTVVGEFQFPIFSWSQYERLDMSGFSHKDLPAIDNLLFSNEPTSSITVPFLLSVTNCTNLTMVHTQYISFIDTNPTLHCINETTYSNTMIFDIPTYEYSIIFADKIGERSGYYGNSFGIPDQDDPDFQLRATSLSFSIQNYTRPYISHQVNLEQIKIGYDISNDTYEGVRFIYLRHAFDSYKMTPTPLANQKLDTLPNIGEISYPYGYTSGTTRKGKVAVSMVTSQLPSGLPLDQSIFFGYVANPNATEFQTKSNGLSNTLIDTTPPSLQQYSLTLGSNNVAQLAFTVFDLDGVQYCNFSLGPYQFNFDRTAIIGGNSTTPKFSKSFPFNRAFCDYPVQLTCTDLKLNLMKQNQGFQIFGSNGIYNLKCTRGNGHPVPISMKAVNTNRTNLEVQIILFQENFISLNAATLTLTPVPGSLETAPVVINMLPINASDYYIGFKGGYTIPNTLKTTTYQASLSITIPTTSTTITYSSSELNYMLGRNVGNYFLESSEDRPVPISIDNSAIVIYNPVDNVPPTLVSIHHQLDSSNTKATVTISLQDQSPVSNIELVVIDYQQPLNPFVYKSTTPVSAGQFQIDINVNSVCGHSDIKYYLSKACDSVGNCQKWSIMDTYPFTDNSIQVKIPGDYFILPPKIIYFDVFPTAVNVMSDTKRNVTFYLTVAGSLLSTQELPVVYIDEWSMYVQPVSCQFQLVSSLGDTHDYECELTIPKYYGLNGVTLSVYGVTNLCGNITGLSTLDLINNGFQSSLILVDFDPNFIKVEPVKYTQKDITITGFNFNTNTLSNYQVSYMDVNIVNNGRRMPVYGMTFAQEDPTPVSNIANPSDALIGDSDQIGTKILVNSTYQLVNSTMAIIILNTTNLSPDIPFYVEDLTFGYTYNLPIFYCPDDCNGNGTCKGPDGHCECFTGFQGLDCSIDATQACAKDQNNNLCGGHGTCSASRLCICDPGFNGPSCNITIDSTSPVDIDIGTRVNLLVEPEFTFKGLDKISNGIGESTFKVAFKSLRELDLYNNIVSEYFFKEMVSIGHPIAGNNITLVALNDQIGRIEIKMYEYVTQTTINWNQETINEVAKSTKYQITISRYPFHSKLNKLQLVWETRAFDQSCGSTYPKLFQFGGKDHDFNYFVLPLHQTGLYARFPNTILIDGVQALASNKLLSARDNESKNATVALEIPYFTKQITIDPDFSTLLTTPNKNNEYKYNPCSPQNGGGDDGGSKPNNTWKIAVGVVVGFLGLALLIAIVIYLVRHNTKAKIGFYNLKRLSRKVLVKN